MTHTSIARASTNSLLAVVVAVLCFAVAIPAASANSISSVESARAKDRQGAYLTEQNVGDLRRYGASSEKGYVGSYGGASYYGPYAYGAPTVGVYIGPDPYDYGPYPYY